MLSVLIDTDIAIDFLRGRKYAKELIASLWEQNTAYLSVLSAYELYAGMKEREREYTKNFIDACIIEPVTGEVAEKAGELYKKYRENGVTLTSIDCLIAATAVLKGHKIATRNVKHYPEKGITYRIKGG